MIKKKINQGLKKAGYQIVNLKKAPPRRGSLKGALQQIKARGFTPTTVIDVGAAFGDWSKEVNTFYPEAEFFLFEPLEEYTKNLEATTGKFKKGTYQITAVGAETTTTTINVHEDLVGSSLYKENEDGKSDGAPRQVSLTTLDEALKNHTTPGPYLLKVDVQGAEKDVLTGAEETLKKCEYIILEVSLFESILGAPQLPEIIKFMKSKGFVPYDILSHLYRPLDGALCQIDLAFVREEGEFRKDQRYCTPAQRAEQNETFRKKIKEKLL